MKFLVRVTLILVIFSYLSSCGVITRTRYGNGLKLNLETHLFKKEDQKSGQKNKGIIWNQESKTKSTEQILDDKYEGFVPIFEYCGLETRFKKTRLTDMVLNPEKKNISTLQLRLAMQPGKLKLKSLQKSIPNAKNNEYPVERNVFAGAILFYIGLIGMLLALGAVLTTGTVYIISGALMLVGFVLTTIGLTNISKSNNAYSGSGCAISVIVMFGISLIIALLVYLIYLISIL